MTNNQQTKKSLKIQLIKSIVWGLVAIIAAFCFVIYTIGNPYNEFRLITKGITAVGRITEAEEFVVDGYRGKAIFYYYYSYSFNLPDGREIKSGGKGNGRLPVVLMDLSDPYPIKVVYLTWKPEINKDKNSICDSVTEFLWRKVGLGTILFLVFSSIGFILIRNGIRDYFTATKKLNVNIDKYEFHDKI